MLAWNGDHLARKVLEAAGEAIDEITAAAAAEAQKDHWWQNETDRLEAETISEPAVVTLHGASGKFGTTRRRGFYGLFLEYQQPFLRPVADRVFPQLPAKLREKLQEKL